MSFPRPNSTDPCCLLGGGNPVRMNLSETKGSHTYCHSHSHQHFPLPTSKLPEGDISSAQSERESCVLSLPLPSTFPSTYTGNCQREIYRQRSLKGSLAYCHSHSHQHFPLPTPETARGRYIVSAA